MSSALAGEKVTCGQSLSADWLNYLLEKVVKGAPHVIGGNSSYNRNYQAAVPSGFTDNGKWGMYKNGTSLYLQGNNEFKQILNAGVLFAAYFEGGVLYMNSASGALERIKDGVVSLISQPALSGQVVFDGTNFWTLEVNAAKTECTAKKYIYDPVLLSIVYDSSLTLTYSFSYATINDVVINNDYICIEELAAIRVFKASDGSLVGNVASLGADQLVNVDGELSTTVYSDGIYHWVPVRIPA